MNMTKEGWVSVSVLLAVALVITGFSRHYVAQDRNYYKLQLAAERAKAATGACGTEFVIAGLGENKNQAAIAGRIIYVNQLGNYYQTEETVKREDTPLDRKMVAVYLRNPDTGRQELLFRRPR